MSLHASALLLAPSPGSADDSGNRRAHPRFRSRHLPRTQARIPSLGAVSLVDLSAGGALLDAPFQVRPHTRFALQLETAVERVQMPLRLLRCHVVALDSRGPIYQAAGTFDNALDIHALVQRASSAAQRLVVTLERLRDSVRKSAAQQRSDAAFADMLGAVIAWLGRGESIELVALKVRAHLTQQYPSLRIFPAAIARRDDAWSVASFGLMMESKHALSAHDRRFLRASAQLISRLDETRQDMRSETGYSEPGPSEVARPPMPQVIHGSSQWIAAQSASDYVN